MGLRVTDRRGIIRDPEDLTVKYRFAQMTMHEVKDAARQDRVAVLPVATYEDHPKSSPKA